MIIRRKLSNAITIVLLLFLFCDAIKQCSTIETNGDDNNRIRRTEMTNIGSDKMEQTPAITHTQQQEQQKPNNNDDVSITQSDAKRVASQVHDFIMQRSQVSSPSSQQVAPENAFDGLTGEPQHHLQAPRGRTSKLFKSYQARSEGPVYQPPPVTETPEPLTLTTTSRGTEAESEEIDEEEDDSDDKNNNNGINEKINPFLVSAFNFITNTVLSSIKSRQSNLDEGRAHVENKVEELNKGMDNGLEHIDVTTAASSSSSADENTQTEKPNDSMAVAEGRYIKGDPLNGYYDFVITEGSYKFWIVFQLFTAALIIYSTFAAIYYSKVNPIVSDYEYQDYLGGRSFPEGASVVDDSQDSVDPGDDSTESKETKSSSWFSGPWLQRTQYAMQFILDAIEHPPK